MVHFAPSTTLCNKSYPFISVPNRKVKEGGNGAACTLPLSSYRIDVWRIFPSKNMEFPMLTMINRSKKDIQIMKYLSLFKWAHMLRFSFQFIRYENIEKLKDNKDRNVN